MKSWKLLLPVALIFLFHACEFNSLEDASSELEADFAAAELIVNEFFEAEAIKNPNQNARKKPWEKSESSITVLKYKKGKKGKPGELLYNTNKDKVKGYQLVDEETITAIITPGEYVFWYNAGGLEKLEGIDFDAASREELDDLPSGLKKDKVWYVKVPEDVDLELLKYDILYKIKGEDQVIRLDPKLRVQR